MSICANQSPIELVLSKLEGTKRAGQSGRQWTACCPAHSDTNPSLGVSVADDGKVLMICRAGCRIEQIVAALSLNMKDLWPSEDRKGRRGNSRRRKKNAVRLEKYDREVVAKNDHKTWLRELKSGKNMSEGLTSGSYHTPMVRLAGYLQIPVEALAADLHLGHRFLTIHDNLTHAFTTAEFKDRSTIVGIYSRCYPMNPVELGKHFHYVQPGSLRGLYLWPQYYDRAGTVFIVEGWSDTLSMTYAGLRVIGRPSVSESSEGHLLEWLSDALSVVDKDTRIIVVGENDRKPDGIWPGERAKATASNLARLLNRVVECSYPREAKDSRDWLTSSCREGMDWLSRGSQYADELLKDALLFDHNAPSAEFSENTQKDINVSDDASVVKIVIDVDEHRVNAQVIKALAKDSQLYVRSGALVTLVQGKLAHIKRAYLREIISYHARFYSPDSGRPSSIPKSCLDAIFERPEWPQLRTVKVVANHPLFLNDGTILNTIGYHVSSGVLMTQTVPVAVPENPTHEDVESAVALLMDLVKDTPFAGASHRSAWLASLLTLIARRAYDGPTPLFLFDANVAASGKTTLAQLAYLIATGNDIPIQAIPSTDEELEKRLTGKLIEGAEAMILDNLDTQLSSDVLEAFATSTSYEGRILGKTGSVRCENSMTLFLTGNNVTLRIDSRRRICYVRLDSPIEDPSRRSDYQRTDIIGFATSNRSKLLSAALTILLGWHTAGRPMTSLRPQASYGAWGNVIRQAIVFAGLADPADSHKDMIETIPDDERSIKTIAFIIGEIDEGGGVTVKKLLDTIQSDSTKYEAANEAIDILADGRSKPNVAVGKKLGSHHGRVWDGRKLQRLSTDKHNKVVRWAFRAVCPKAEPQLSELSAGDAGIAGKGSP